MALSWITVLQAVPWSEVIRNAPKVADGARKLWSTVAGKPGDAQDAEEARKAEAPLSDTGLGPQAQAMAALERRLADTQADVAQLHEQMLASSELIQALADQNAQLIRRAEANRVRTLWAGVGAALALALAIAAFVQQA